MTENKLINNDVKQLEYIGKKRRNEELTPNTNSSTKIKIDLRQFTKADSIEMPITIDNNAKNNSQPNLTQNNLYKNAFCLQLKESKLSFLTPTVFKTIKTAPIRTIIQNDEVLNLKEPLPNRNITAENNSLNYQVENHRVTEELNEFNKHISLSDYFNDELFKKRSKLLLDKSFNDIRSKDKLAQLITNCSNYRKISESNDHLTQN